MASSTRSSLMVFDNSLKDPDRLRSEARQLDFATRRDGYNAATMLSAPSKYRPQILRRIMDLARTRARWARDSANYRRTSAAAIQRARAQYQVHSDYVFDIIGLLYLSPPADCQGGTGFFRHKATGLEGFHDLDAVANAVLRLKTSLDGLRRHVEADSADGTAWDLTDLVQMKYNRLVVYDGRMFHSHVVDFARLAHPAERLTLGAWGVRV